MPHLLISGGSRGIGRACAELFASNGYSVSYLYHTRTEFESDNIMPIKCDVSDMIQVQAAVNTACEKYGNIDVLISNAGISLTSLSQDTDYSDYRSVMDVNFGGFYNLTHYVIPKMIEAKKGVILAVSSMWGQTGASCEALYSASKGAVDAYVKSLAKELGPSGIRVNAVSPGTIETDMMSCFSEEDKAVLAEDTPLGRLGTPEEVAEVMYFLSSDKSSYITGQIIGVNGGFLI